MIRHIQVHLYLLIEMRHTFPIEYDIMCTEVEYNFKVETDIFKKLLKRSLGVLRGEFEGLGVQITVRCPAS